MFEKLFPLIQSGKPAKISSAYEKAAAKGYDLQGELEKWFASVHKVELPEERYYAEIDFNAPFGEVTPESLERFFSYTALEFDECTSDTIREMPEWIFAMKNLKTLNIYKVREIPEAIGELTALTSLGCHYSSITQLPESIGKLKNLKVLSLYENQLTSVPESIGNCTKLKELYLEKNQLTALPESIGNLKNIIYLKAYENRLTALPDSIGEMNALQILSMDDNQLTKLPDTLGNCKNLLYIYARNNKLTALPETLNGCDSLDIVELGDNQITKIPETLGECPKLHWVVMTNNLIEEIPESLGKAQYMASLQLNGNRLTAIPGSLKNCPKLKSIFVEENRIETIPAELSESPKLCAIYIKGNPITSLPAELNKKGFTLGIDPILEQKFSSFIAECSLIRYYQEGKPESTVQESTESVDVDELDYRSLTEAVKEAAKKSFTEVQKAHPTENFFIFVLSTLDDFSYISASVNSKESCERAADEWYQWNPTEWEYEYTGQSNFSDADDTLQELAEQIDETQFADHCEQVFSCMKEAMKELDAEGFWDEQKKKGPLFRYITVYESDDPEQYENSSSEYLNSPEDHALFTARFVKS